MRRRACRTNHRVYRHASFGKYACYRLGWRCELSDPPQPNHTTRGFDKFDVRKSLQRQAGWGARPAQSGIVSFRPIGQAHDRPRGIWCSDGHESLQTTCSESGARGLQDHQMPAASKERRCWHLTAIVIKFSAESGVERHRCSAQADMAKPFCVWNSFVCQKTVVLFCGLKWLP